MNKGTMIDKFCLEGVFATENFIFRITLDCIVFSVNSALLNNVIVKKLKIA